MSSFPKNLPGILTREVQAEKEIRSYAHSVSNSARGNPSCLMMPNGCQRAILRELAQER